jgi:hypothetical protein
MESYDFYIQIKLYLGFVWEIFGRGRVQVGYDTEIRIPDWVNTD